MNRGVRVAVLFALACAPQSSETTVSASPNSLSRAEDSAGWKLLFDGRTTNGWRGYRRNDFPDNTWTIENGVLQIAAGTESYIITRDKYQNFELMLDWKVAPGGNSGVLYRSTEVDALIWHSSPEMQILDDSGHPDGKNPLTSAGAMFAVYPAPRGIVKPAGEWNTARLLVQGNHVEHWLNGTKLLEYELGSDDFKARVARSKFKSMPNFGKASAGYIGLQGHGGPDDHAEFRNIKIRVLP